MTIVDILAPPSTANFFANHVQGPSHLNLSVILHDSCQELGFQQPWDDPKGEKVLHRGRGSEAGFLLLPPLFCSHYGPGILLPQHRKQRTGLKDPSSLWSSRNCLWHCLSSVIIQLCPVTSSCPNSCYQSGTRERYGGEVKPLQSWQGSENGAWWWTSHHLTWMQTYILLDWPFPESNGSPRASFLLHCWPFRGDSFW